MVAEKSKVCRLAGTKAQIFLAEQVHQASGRSHHDVDTGAELGLLRAFAHAAENHGMP
jgi:hypothetical protein